MPVVVFCITMCLRPVGQKKRKQRYLFSSLTFHFILPFHAHPFIAFLLFLYRRRELTMSKRVYNLYRTCNDKELLFKFNRFKNICNNIKSRQSKVIRKNGSLYDIQIYRKVYLNMQNEKSNVNSNQFEFAEI